MRFLPDCPHNMTAALRVAYLSRHPDTSSTLSRVSFRPDGKAGTLTILATDATLVSRTVVEGKFIGAGAVDDVREVEMFTWPENARCESIGFTKRRLSFDVSSGESISWSIRDYEKPLPKWDDLDKSRRDQSGSASGSWYVTCQMLRRLGEIAEAADPHSRTRLEAGDTHAALKLTMSTGPAVEVMFMPCRDESADA